MCRAFCPEPYVEDDPAETHSYPDADIGGVPDTRTFWRCVNVLCGPTSPRKSKREAQTMNVRGVWVYPFNFPCPLFQALHRAQRSNILT